MEYKKKKESVYLENGRVLYRSKAYMSLTGKAPHIFSVLLCKRQVEDINRGKRSKGKRMIIKNNGEIVFIYKEANSYGISDFQFNKGIDQLVKYGFINVAPGFPLKFEFIENWKDFGCDKFKPGKRVKTNLLFKLPKNDIEKLKWMRLRFGNTKSVVNFEKKLRKHEEASELKIERRKIKRRKIKI